MKPQDHVRKQLACDRFRFRDDSISCFTCAIVDKAFRFESAVMVRIFQIADTTTHCGVRTQVSCIVLGAVETCLEIFCFVLLPVAPRWIFISFAALLLLLLAAGAATRKPLLIIVFLVANALMKIPLFVIIYFTTFTLVSYDYPGIDIFADCYQCWLYRQSVGFLWAGLIISFLCLVVDGILTSGVRKLRLLSRGVTTIAVAERDCHRPRSAVIEAQQHGPIVTEDSPQVIYTTPASASVVYPGAAVYQTPGYLVTQPYVYQPTSNIGLPAPVVYPAPVPSNVVYPSTSQYQTPTYPVAQPFTFQQPQHLEEQNSASPQSKHQAPPEYSP